MKKIVLSASLILGFGVYGFATNKIEVSNNQQQEPVKKVTKEKKQKYDFSLFKFIRTAPTLKKVETDSTQRKGESRGNLDKLKDQTTDNTYEKPFNFFKLS